MSSLVRPRQPFVGWGLRAAYVESAPKAPQIGSGSMRKTSIFISSVVMLLAGFSLVIDEIFWETQTFGLALVGGVALMALGAYLQWEASKK